MYIKNPNQKVSYSFRIDEELLDDLKTYAQATNRKLPETLNVLLKKQLEGITVSDTYLQNVIFCVLGIISFFNNN